jgi:hypothetical protein
VVQRATPTTLIEWLHSLDSYTNAEFGTARSLATQRDECVACDATAALDRSGLCPRCAAKRVADHTEIVLFRALRRPQPDRA